MRSTTTSFSAPIAVLTLAALAAAPALGRTAPAATLAAPSAPSYRLPDREVVLVEVAGVVSVGLRDGAWRAKTLRLASGEALALGRATRDGGWRVDVAPRAEIATRDDKERVEKGELVRRIHDESVLALRADPEVEWAYPAYRSVDTGTLLLPTPWILLQAAPGTSEERLRVELGDVLVEEPLLLAEGQWRVRLVDLDDDPLAVANRLTERHPWIEWAEPDFVFEIEYTALPNDPLVPQSWHVKNTGQGGGVVGADARLEQAWNITTGNGNVVIAVLDDGVQLAHPDLASRIFVNPGEVANGLDDDSNGLVDDVRGWDFFHNDNIADPDLTGPPSHGTAVAGVAAAVGGNGVGGTGACQNCRILPVRISGSGFANSSTLANAINYAGSLADVLNNSWGGGAPSAAIGSAIVNVSTNGRGGKGAPVLFANGNSATGYITYTLTTAGVPPGTWTFEWIFDKDASVDAGLDSAWLDNVKLPNGSLQTFESCTSLPGGWSTGPSAWTVTPSETRAASTLGGRCAAQAGVPGIHSRSSLQVTTPVTGAAGETLVYEAWVSAERQGTADGTGPLTGNCYDSLRLEARDDVGGVYGPFFVRCGTYSNQGNPLMDGQLSFPSSHPAAISVGAATNFDMRSDYSQWGVDMNGDPGIDFVAHSGGGSREITTTDVTGGAGYGPGNYTDGFGGTSSATPLAAGIVGLLLTAEPNLTAAQVRTRLRQATRKIGTAPYSGGYNLGYGYGALDAAKLLGDSCGLPSVLDVDAQDVATTELFEACDEVHAGTGGFRVLDGGDVTFRAGSRIVLEDGFEVQPGGSFRAVIE